MDEVLFRCDKVQAHPLPATGRGPAGYRAAEFQVGFWGGSLSVVRRRRGQAESELYISLKSRDPPEEREVLFAEAKVPVEDYTLAVEKVTDSTRYFAIRLANPDGRFAWIGIGFATRVQAFDFQEALQAGTTEREVAKPEVGSLDLSTGEFLKVQFNIPECTIPESTMAEPAGRRREADISVPFPDDCSTADTAGCISAPAKTNCEAPIPSESVRQRESPMLNPFRSDSFYSEECASPPAERSLPFTPYVVHVPCLMTPQGLIPPPWLVPAVVTDPKTEDYWGHLPPMPPLETLIEKM